jgi:hypothetical protein
VDNYINFRIYFLCALKIVETLEGICEVGVECTVAESTCTGAIGAQKCTCGFGTTANTATNICEQSYLFNSHLERDTNFSLIFKVPLEVHAQLPISADYCLDHFATLQVKNAYADLLTSKTLTNAS